MNEAEIIEICRQAIWVMLKILGPLLMAGLVVGVLVSIFQAITHIQEPALPFIPKLVAIFALTLWLLPFMLATLGGFANNLADKIVEVGSYK